MINSKVEIEICKKNKPIESDEKSVTASKGWTN